MKKSERKVVIAGIQRDIDLLKKQINTKKEEIKRIRASSVGASSKKSTIESAKRSIENLKKSLEVKKNYMKVQKENLKTDLKG